MNEMTRPEVHNTIARYLYRGASKQHHELRNGRLEPKEQVPFSYTFRRDGSMPRDRSGQTPGAGATRDDSEVNAVLKHELLQRGYPTSGISTTPHFERARFYALGRASEGYVYKIDRLLLPQYSVREYIVAEWLPVPSIPEDDEVILVATDFAALPQEVIVEVIAAAAAG